MRWLVAALGAAALLLAGYVALRLRRARPELRVALNLAPGDPDDAALAAGVDLALDDRDFRAGRWRVRAAHQTAGPSGVPVIPNPPPHTMLYGLRPVVLPRADGSETPLFSVEEVRDVLLVLAWARGHGRTRVVIVDPLTWWSGAEPELLPLRPQDPLAVALTRDVGGVRAVVWTGEPDGTPLDPDRDLVFVTSHRQYGPDFVPRIRRGGFDGPVFLASSLLTRFKGLLPRGEGCRVFLAPLLPPPADFLRRHPHPVAYLGYRGTLRHLDAWEAAPKESPYEVARKEGRKPVFDDHLGDPGLFVIRGGRLVADPEK